MVSLVSKPRIWIKVEDHLTVNPQTLDLLGQVRKYRSISRASEAMSISFRHAWNLIDRLENQLGEKILLRSRGGKGGGGLATLTEKGSDLVNEYQRVAKGVQSIVAEEGFWEALGLKISARNKIVGKITRIKKDSVATRVEIASSKPVKVISIITSDAAEDLELKIGDKVTAIVKATEVLIVKGPD